MQKLLSNCFSFAAIAKFFLATITWMLIAGLIIPPGFAESSKAFRGGKFILRLKEGNPHLTTAQGEKLKPKPGYRVFFFATEVEEVVGENFTRQPSRCRENTPPVAGWLKNPLILQEGDDFDPTADLPECKAYDKEDGWLSPAKITITGAEDVDTTVPDTYLVTCVGEDSQGAQGEAILEIIVEPNTSPAAIWLSTNPLELTIGDNFILPECVITDNETSESELPNPIITGAEDVDTNTVGTYNVICTGTDPQGAQSQPAVLVVNVNEEPPTENQQGIAIWLSPNPVYITQGDKFVRPECIGSDPEDGIIPFEKMVITGDVDTNTPGQYELTCSGTDSDGLALVPAELTVVVESNLPTNCSQLYLLKPVDINGDPVVRRVDSITSIRNITLDEGYICAEERRATVYIKKQLTRGELLDFFPISDKKEILLPTDQEKFTMEITTNLNVRDNKKTGAIQTDPEGYTRWRTKTVGEGFVYYDDNVVLTSRTKRFKIIKPKK